METGKVLIELDYQLDSGQRTVRLSHPDLLGSLGFEASSPALAEVQIKALAAKHKPTAIEQFCEDLKDIKEMVSKLGFGKKD
jgi:hypothetical protein